MTDSIKLMKKDVSLIFKINKMNLFIFIYPLTMSSLIFTSNLNQSLQIIMSSAAYGVFGVVIGLISTEEKSKTSLIFQSIPVKQENLVIGKYLFAAVIILFSSVLSSIFPAIKSIAEGNVEYVKLSLINSIIFSILLFSLFFPLFYRFGYLKLQTINLVIFYGLIAIPMLLVFLGNIEAIRPLGSLLVNSMNSIKENPALAFILSLALYGLSSIVSTKLVNNK